MAENMQPSPAVKASRQTFLKRNLKKLVLLLTFVATFSTLLLLFENRTQNVSTNIPENFPILVITPGKGGQSFHAEIVTHFSLEKYIKDNPNYSYLIPAGGEQSTIDQLKSQVKNSRDESDPETGFDALSFEMARLPNGRQSFAVNLKMPGMDSMLEYTSWYDATDKEIFPKQFRGRIINGALIMAMGFISFITTAVVWLLWTTVSFLNRKLRVKKPAQS
jgi:hypothetical protein